MRLLTDVRTRFLTKACALGLATLLAACGRGGTDIAPLASAADRPAVETASGPAADYPVVVGEPYSVGSVLYTPRDTMNFDEVGYATLDRDGGDSISIAHKTLPLPSYVEITSLDNGTTVLARAERRGPMSNEHVAAMSPSALARLGIKAGAPIRIRRTNPPESDRARLRTGQTAQPRMSTPKSLLAVLKRKLPATGSANLAAVKPNLQPNAKPKPPSVAAKELPAIAKAPTSTPKVAAKAAPTVPVASRPKPSSFAGAFSQQRKAVTAYPLKPMSGAPRAVVQARRPTVVSRAPVRVTRNITPPAASRARPPVPTSTPARVPVQATEGAFVVQAAAFSSKANAQRAANSLNGFVQKSGRFFRVRTGPFTNRGQAEAALAKVRAAGYSDARVFTSG